MSDVSKEFLAKLIQPHTPERFQQLLKMFCCIEGVDTGMWLNKTEDKIGKDIIFYVNEYFVNFNKRPLIKIIDELASSRKMPLLLRIKNRDDLAKYVLLLLFKDATVGDVPLRENVMIRDKAFHTYLQKVAGEFGGGDPANNRLDNAIGVAIVSLEDELNRIPLERLVVASRRVGVFLVVKKQSVANMFMRMLQDARKEFNDVAVIGRAVEYICAEVRSDQKRSWRTFWRLHPRDLAKVCKYAKTNGIDIIILSDPRCALDKPLNDTIVREVLRDVLKYTYVKNKTILPIPKIYASAKRTILRRLGKALNIPLLNIREEIEPNRGGGINGALLYR